jgi:hypothetical protein
LRTRNTPTTHRYPAAREVVSISPRSPVTIVDTGGSLGLRRPIGTKYERLDAELVVLLCSEDRGPGRIGIRRTEISGTSACAMLRCSNGTARRLRQLHTRLNSQQPPPTTYECAWHSLGLRASPWRREGPQSIRT